MPDAADPGAKVVPLKDFTRKAKKGGGGGDGGEGGGPQARGRRQGIEANELNIGIALRGRDELHDGTMLRFDTFTGQVIVAKPIPRPNIDQAAFQPHKLTDVDVTHLIEWFQANGFKKVARNRMDFAIEAEAHRNRFSSAQERFNALPPWDGVERAKQWLVRTGCIGDPEYLAAVGLAFLIAICARVSRPGAKVDTMPVFEGPQGNLKSTMLRMLSLCDDWFTDNLPHNLGSKDAKVHLAGKLIVEMGEIAQLDRNSSSVLKQFLSMQEDKYRPPYGRHDITQPRQCVFAGTTNDDQYLKDITGNRRYWPIKVEKIDLGYLKDNLEQLYAEALAAYRKGDNWWLTDRGEELAVQEQSDRVMRDPWEGIIRENLALLEGDAVVREELFYEVPVDRVIKDWLQIPLEKRDERVSDRVGKLLKLLGGVAVRPRVDGRRISVRRFRIGDLDRV